MCTFGIGDSALMDGLDNVQMLKDGEVLVTRISAEKGLGRRIYLRR
jgi:hypothetical protein